MGPGEFRSRGLTVVVAVAVLLGGLTVGATSSSAATTRDGTSPPQARAACGPATLACVHVGRVVVLRYGPKVAKRLSGAKSGAKKMAKGAVKKGRER